MLSEVIDLPVQQIMACVRRSPIDLTLQLARVSSLA